MFIFLCSIVLQVFVDGFLFCPLIPTPSFPLFFGSCELIPRLYRILYHVAYTARLPDR